MDSCLAYFMWGFVLPLILFAIITSAGSSFGTLYGTLLIFSLYLLLVVIVVLLICCPARSPFSCTSSNHVYRFDP